MKPLPLSGANIKQHLRSLIKLARRHRFFLLGLIPVIIWCLPYFTTSNKIELGDFSFFAQGYEAIRLSIVEYGQFPWWNPWVSGGVPLYANPQFGLFSIQTLLTLLTDSVAALKTTLAIFTVLGYASMYLLARRYFKASQHVSALIGLVWIFCSFFSAHLPTHFTFIWYLLTPLFVYIALSVRTWKGGIALGLMFALMANSQLHNPFVHISIIAGAIIFARLVIAAVRKNNTIKPLLLALVVAASLFTLLAGHRLVFTYQNMYQFPRDNSDSAASIEGAATGLILPYSNIHRLPIDYPSRTHIPHGFFETTGTFGIFTIITLFLCVLYGAYIIATNRHKIASSKKLKKQLIRYRLPIILLAAAALCALIGLGHKFNFMPYSILKQLPVLSDMRVSTRWYIFAILFGLLFIGLIHKLSKKERFFRFTIVALLACGVVELFALNVGYQAKTFSWNPNLYSEDASQLEFGQVSRFSDINTLPGTELDIPRGSKIPEKFREYEATSYNLGTLHANDALVQIQHANRDSPRCGLSIGCSFVLSGNAVVDSWSPNRVVLKRTGPGDILLNMNASSYMLVNGQYIFKDLRVAEPFNETAITDASEVVTIEVAPSLPESLSSIIQRSPEPPRDYTHK